MKQTIHDVGTYKSTFMFITNRFGT